MLFLGEYQSGVKHLNPRQGITTHTPADPPTAEKLACETPKSPPGDYNFVLLLCGLPQWLCCVKHLNPRQGITTREMQPLHAFAAFPRRCETPKSPPGDYNLLRQRYLPQHNSNK